MLEIPAFACVLRACRRGHGHRWTECSHTSRPSRPYGPARPRPGTATIGTASAAGAPDQLSCVGPDLSDRFWDVWHSPRHPDVQTPAGRLRYRFANRCGAARLQRTRVQSACRRRPSGADPLSPVPRPPCHIWSLQPVSGGDGGCRTSRQIGRAALCICRNSRGVAAADPWLPIPANPCLPLSQW
jgi:hypothetical protein